MKNISLTLILVLISLTSCTKEITPNLADTDSKIVIEGIITNDSNLQTIKISKSVLFYESNTYPPVTTAVVSVSDNNGTPILFTEVTPGIYQANFTGIPNHSYKLSVTIDGKEYISISQMPQPVPLINLTYEESTFSTPGSATTYTVTPIFIDPADKINFYRFSVTIDGKQDSYINTLDDNLINGLQNNFAIFRTKEDIISGSVVKLTMYGIEKPVHDYFYVLQQNIDAQGTPNNPISNINSGVLGYFSAQNKQEATIIIP